MAEISKQALQVANNTDFPDNSTGYITPAILRSYNTDVIDSTVNQTVYTANSSSWNSSISQLNSFTASQQPSFTALNAFTASQLSINSNLNAATQSLSASIAPLQPQIDALENWTGSINQIIEDNVSKGYATRFNFGGLISASITANVGGNIADISVNSDTTKLNTSSFNEYTASAATSLNNYSASQAIWNSSATASIVQLLSFSSSLDATYATDAQLAAVSSSLKNSIDTKLNTSSFNSYTASLSSSLMNLGFATTASNRFFGDQTITGSLTTNGGATFGNTTAQYNSVAIVTSNTTYPGNLYNTFYINADDNGPYSAGVGVSTYTSFGSNPAAFLFGGGVGNNGDNNILTSYDNVVRINKNTQITGSATITGSMYGNVVPLTISSNTASMDLSKGNFFTLTLVSGSTTRLSPSNIKAGQTINLLITQASVGTGSLSYDSTFKFTPGNQYTASVSSSAKDIITFITFDNSAIYASAIKNLV